MKNITDSALLAQNEVLNSRLDSIVKIVEKTEIGQGYFSDIISLQTTIFLLVLGFLAFVSWGSIVLFLKNKIKKQNKEFNKKIENQNIIFTRLNEEFNKKAELHELRIADNEIDILTSFYFFSLSKEHYILSATFCCNIIKIYLIKLERKEEDNDTIENIEGWLNWLDEALSKNRRETLSADDFNSIHEVLMKVSSIGNIKLNKVSEDVKRNLSKIYYNPKI